MRRRCHGGGGGGKLKLILKDRSHPGELLKNPCPRPSWDEEEVPLYNLE